MAAQVEVIFPDRPLGVQNAIDTIAELRALDSTLVNENTEVLVANNGFYKYDPSSLAADNGTTVIKPDDLTSLQAGRWELVLTPSATTISFTQGGTGAVPRSVQAKLRDIISPLDFGAIGNGTADDTVALQNAINAVPDGGALDLGGGYKYKVNTSFVLERPINIAGGTAEKSQVICAAGGSYVDLGDGSYGAFVFLHSDTVLPGYSGNAARSVLSNFDVVMEAGSTDDVRGVVICTPIYAEQVWVRGFTSTGFSVIAAPTFAPSSAPLLGNANGCAFTNCVAIENASHGFYFVGDNANACKLDRCAGSVNGAWGFYDDGGLGNTYDACEADSNVLGGYWANPAKPIASTYVGCYSETVTHFSVGPLCVIIGQQGIGKPNRAQGGVAMRGLPTNGCYVSQQIAIAATDDIAESAGAAPNAGAFMGVSDAGINYRATATSLRWMLTGVLSANYTDITVNGVPLVRFPNSAVAANVVPTRPWFPNGLTFGDGSPAFIGSVNGVGNLPAAATYAAGAMMFNSNVASGQPIAWTTTGAAWVAWANYA